MNTITREWLTLFKSNLTPPPEPVLGHGEVTLHTNMFHGEVETETVTNPRGSMYGIFTYIFP